MPNDRELNGPGSHPHLLIVPHSALMKAPTSRTASRLGKSALLCERISINLAGYSGEQPVPLVPGDPGVRTG